jgi:hypothetical protein
MRLRLMIGAGYLFALIVCLGQPAPVHAQKKVLELKDGKVDIDASLAADDPSDAVRKQHKYKVFLIGFKKGETYQIDMRSKSIDCFLRLEDANGKQLAKDDDSGGGANNVDARIVFDCPADGKYRIICTTWAKAELGKFHLSVHKK